MPELPEIETIRRDVERLLQGQATFELTIKDRRLLTESAEKRVQKALLGQTWQSVERRGKYLRIRLGNGYQLVFHLRMTGQLIVVTAGKSALSYRALFRFGHGMELGFYDQRRFGEIFLVEPGKEWPSIERLGPEPLGPLTRDQFVQAVRAKTSRIKPLLMDQRFLAGVGNIYAQEALFRAKIRPGRSANRLSRLEAENLFDAIQETLRMAILHRGSSSRNYLDAEGNQGTAQKLHQVYRKSGLPCPVCRTILRSSRVGGRGTVFCGVCQK